MRFYGLSIALVALIGLEILFTRTSLSLAGSDKILPNVDLDHLINLNDSDCERQLEKIGAERDELQARIVRELRSDSVSRDKFIAIYLAGLFRLEGTIPDLANLIALRNEKWKSTIVKGNLPLWAEFPSLEALEKIGDRCIPSMLHNLGTSDDKEVRRLSLKCMKDLIGVEEGHRRLQNAIAQGRDANEVANLKLALENLTQ